MSKITNQIAVYHSFFGEISVDEVDAQNSLVNYSVHASLDSDLLDSKMKAMDEAAAAN